MARMKPCAAPGCSRLVPRGQARCEAHEQAMTEQRRRRLDATPAGRCSAYHTSRWRKARALWLREHPLCARCGRAGEHVHHLEAHGGELTRFWAGVDAGRLATLCAPCHLATSGREAARLQARSRARGDALADEGRTARGQDEDGD